MVIFIDIGCVTRRVQARVVVGLAGCPASPGACVSVFLARHSRISLCLLHHPAPPRPDEQRRHAGKQGQGAQAQRPVYPDHPAAEADREPAERTAAEAADVE